MGRYAARKAQSISDRDMHSKSGSNVLPVILLLCGATCWGVLWYPLRWLEDGGISGLWSTLIIYGSALVVGLPWLLPRRAVLHDAGPLTVMALASGWCNVSFILAVLDGHVVRVILLFYLSPLWTVVLGRFLLHERLTSAARTTIVVAMLGALVMLWDEKIGLPWPRSGADWLAISSGLAFALSNTMVRRVQATGVWTKAALAWLGVVVLAVVWITFGNEPEPQAAPAVVWVAVGVGAIGMVFMTIAVVYGVTHMPVHRSAVLLLFELVAGALSAQWLTDEVVLPREWIGGAMILTAAWFAARTQVHEASA